MPYLILLALIIAYVQPTWPAPPSWLSPMGAVFAIWLAISFLLLTTAIYVRRFAYCVRRVQELPVKILKGYSRFRRLFAWLLFSVFLCGTYFLGWGWTVQQWMGSGINAIPGKELVILLPFLTGSFLSWLKFFDAERAISDRYGWSDHESIASRWVYVNLQARQSLLLATPPLLLLVVQQVLVKFVPEKTFGSIGIGIIGGILIAALFIGQGLLVRLVLGLKPLPRSPLRDRLEATCRRTNIRVSQLLQWNTKDTMASALLTGPLPIFRYVVFTDRLLKHMSEDEIEAVLAHELGHVKHKHMIIYLGFLFTSLLLLQLLGDWTISDTTTPGRWLHDWHLQLQGFIPPSLLPTLFLAPVLGFIGIYLIIVFGVISRRCERQADLYACRQTSYVAFLSALDTVAQLNDMDKSGGGWFANWRHGSIQQRIDYLLGTIADGNAAHRFQLCQIVRFKDAKANDA